MSAEPAYGTVTDHAAVSPDSKPEAKSGHPLKTYIPASPPAANTYPLEIATPNIL